MSNRRLRRYRNKKPASTSSVACGTVGCISLLASIVIISSSAASEEGIPNILGAIAVVLMVVSVVALVVAWRNCHNTNFNTASRVFGVIGAIVGMVPWILSYLIGIFVG